MQTGIERSDDVFVAYPGTAHAGAYDGIDNDTSYPAGPAPHRGPAGGHASQRLTVETGRRRRAARRGRPVRRHTGDRRAWWPREARSRRGSLPRLAFPLCRGTSSVARQLAGSARDDSQPEPRPPAVWGRPIRLASACGLASIRRGTRSKSSASSPTRGCTNLKSTDVFAAYTPALRGSGCQLQVLRDSRRQRVVPRVERGGGEPGREQLGNMVTLQYIADRSLLLERLTAMMSSFFGALVLLLAGVGLFGLMSYTVAQRRREIGIRMALGADRRRVVRDVVRDGLTVTLAGLAVGVVAALAAVRVVDTLLFGVTPQDPLTLAGAGASLIAIALLACFVPASRAARVDPVIALRGRSRSASRVRDVVPLTTDRALKLYPVLRVEPLFASRRPRPSTRATWSARSGQAQRGPWLQVAARERDPVAPGSAASIPSNTTRPPLLLPPGPDR